MYKALLYDLGARMSYVEQKIRDVRETLDYYDNMNRPIEAGITQECLILLESERAFLRRVIDRCGQDKAQGDPLRKHLHPTAETPHHTEILVYLGKSYDLNCIDLEPMGPSAIRATDSSGTSNIYEVRGDTLWEIDEKAGTEREAPLARQEWRL